MFLSNTLVAVGLVAIAGVVAGAPDGCSTSVAGHFEITVVSKGQSTPKMLKRKQCGGDTTLVLSLADSVLKDARNRTGYIAAASSQLQFDEPPQAGATGATGYSICADGTLALDDSALWYRCKSGDFYNLYRHENATQCEEVLLSAIACGDDVPDVAAPAGAVVVTTVVPVLSGTQLLQVPTEVPVPVCQINDGQIQAHPQPCGNIHINTVTLGIPPPPPPATTPILEPSTSAPPPVTSEQRPTTTPTTPTVTPSAPPEAPPVATANMGAQPAVGVGTLAILLAAAFMALA